MTIEINGTKYLLTKRMAEAGDLVLLTEHTLKTAFIMKSSDSTATDSEGNDLLLSEYIVLESMDSGVDADVFIGAN